MNTSMHTLELDPAVTWRLVGTRRAVARRPGRAAAAISQDTGAAREPAAEVPRVMDDRIPLDGRDAVELGCFLATLAAIGVLQGGLLALLA